MAEVVKVQRCIEPPDGPAMIYGKGRLHSELRDFRRLPVPVKAKLKHHLKVYCAADWIGDHWRLNDIVADEDW
jgi:hypothetical protein